MKNEHSVLKNKNDFLGLNFFFFLSELFLEFGVSEDIKTQQAAKVQV